MATPNPGAVSFEAEEAQPFQRMSGTARKRKDARNEPDNPVW